MLVSVLVFAFCAQHTPACPLNLDADQLLPQMEVGTLLWDPVHKITVLEIKRKLHKFTKKDLF